MVSLIISLVVVSIVQCAMCLEEGLTADQFYGFGPWKRPECRRCTVEKATDGRYARRTPERRKVIADKNNRRPGQRYGILMQAAKRVGQPCDITREQYEALLTLPCHYCGLSTNETGTGLDRKLAGGPYTIGNVVPACWYCNAKKAHLFTYDEMLVLGKTIREIRLAREAFKDWP